MAYNTLNGQGAIDIQTLLAFPILDTPIFYPMFLFVIFIVFTSLTFFREVTREGKGNILSSLAVAGYVTISISVILSVLGLITTPVLVTTVVGTLVFQVLYLLTRRN